MCYLYRLMGKMKKFFTAGIFLLLISTGITENSGIIYTHVTLGNNEEFQHNSTLSHRGQDIDHSIQINNPKIQRNILRVPISENSFQSYDSTLNGQRGPILKIKGIIIKVNGQDTAAGGISYIIEVIEILEGEHPWIIGEEIMVGITIFNCLGSYDFFQAGDEVEVYGEYWGMSSGQTVQKYLDICSSPQYYIKKTEGGQRECESGWDVYLIDIHSYEVAPNEPINGVIEYQIWNSSRCPSCPHQLIIGINEDAKQCLFNGTPDVCPGKTRGTSQFSFSAPSSLGTYYIMVSHAQESSCEDAMGRYSRSDKVKLLEISVIDPCTLDSDNDGIYDCVDRCPHEKGMNEDGCPSEISVEICNNEIDDDGDGKIDCMDADCRTFPSCNNGSDLSLESITISPPTIENGSYVTITLEIANIGDATFSGGNIYIQLDFMDLEGTIAGARIIYQLFYEEKVDYLRSGESDTVRLRDVYIQDHAIIKKTIVIDTVNVKFRSVNKEDNPLNNQKRVPISINPSKSDIINCISMWIRVYLQTHGITFNFDINTMTASDWMNVFFDLTKSLTVDYPKVSEHLRRGSLKDGGIEFALFAFEMLKFYEIVYSKVDPVTFVITTLNSYINGVMGCANMATWTIQFVIGYVSEINLHDIHITALWCESPVDMRVIDNGGRETIITMEGQSINEIPKSECSLIENKKLLLLPTCPCTVEINGRDAGSFDLTIVRGKNDLSTDVVVYEDVPVYFNSQAVIDMGPSTDYTMNLDKDGDGVFEENIYPTMEKKEEKTSKKTIIYFFLIILLITIVALLIFYTRK